MADPTVLEELPLPRNPDDPGRGALIMGLTWSTTGLAIIATALRMAIHRRSKTSWLMDDWLMILATTLQIVFEICLTIAHSYGLGKHDVDMVRPDELVPASMWGWIGTAPGVMASLFGRISSAILLVRIFSVHRRFKWFLIIFTTWQAVLHIVLLVCTWLQNDPVEGLWNPTVPGLDHWDPRAVLYITYITQSSCAVSDLTYVFIPSVIIWELHMNLRRRVGLVIVMLVSTLTTAVSILRATGANGGAGAMADAQYHASLLLLYGGIEQAAVILLGNVPTLTDMLKTHRWSTSSMHFFGASLSGLTGGACGASAAKPGGYPSSGTYEDLEMNTHKLGRLGDTKHEVGVPVVASDDTGSNKSLVVEGYVRRTDVFTVEYGESDEAGRAPAMAGETCGKEP